PEIYTLSLHDALPISVFTGELPDRFHLGLFDGTVSTALQVGVELIEMFRYGLAGAEAGHAFFQPPVRHCFLELFPRQHLQALHQRGTDQSLLIRTMTT